MSALGAAGSGKLVIVSTPIGNLGDMTLRAQQALTGADAVCAEDTRVTAKLLSAFDIHTRLERLDENLIGTHAAQIVERVLAGQVIAYCTDAGMPGVSDPGLRLVAAARQAGAPVEVIPGANAVCTAYVTSGCVNPRFYFGGFFPRKAQERVSALEALRPLDAALIFYESPRRLADALQVVAQVFPLRQVSVCRELTKLHEEVYRGLAPQVASEFARREAEGGVKGEIVLVIDSAPEGELAGARDTACADAANLAQELRSQGLRTKDISRELMSRFGISRNDAYRIAAS